MKINEKMLESMSVLYFKGKTHEQIADSLGVSRATVDYWVLKRSDLFPPRMKRDESWWRTVLELFDGAPAFEIANVLGCHKATVYRWMRRIRDNA